MKPWKGELASLDNGTSAKLQWGHGDEAVERTTNPRTNPRNLPRFNGATAMKPWKGRPWKSGRVPNLALLQWGHGDEAVERRVRDEADAGGRGFNGATAMKPWKERERHALAAFVEQASMGPRR